jgi:hypothetical protein
MNGTGFLGRVRELHPDTVRIVPSGVTELDTLIQAVNPGCRLRVPDQPWDDELLRGQVRDAFRYHDAVIKARATLSGGGRAVAN